MSNPLDDLISGALGETVNSVSLENSESEKSTTEISQSVSPQGEITSTVKLSYTTIRKARSNFSTNIPDERYAAIIETAIGDMTPKIRDCSGEEMAEIIAYHMECARFIQGIFYEHVRQAVHAGAPVKVTRQEIEKMRADAKAEREKKLAHEGTAAKRRKATIDKAKKGEETPIFERLLKSTDAAQRSAGKFMKSQIMMGIPEVAALKNWNDICAMSNNAAGMVLNIGGKRLDEVMKEKK